MGAIVTHTLHKNVKTPLQFFIVNIVVCVFNWPLPVNEGRVTVTSLKDHAVFLAFYTHDSVADSKNTDHAVFALRIQVYVVTCEFTI